MSTYGVELFLRNVGPLAVGDGSEGVLNLFRALNVFGFLANHKRHVFLQRNVAITIRIDNICSTTKPINVAQKYSIANKTKFLTDDGFEFGIDLPLFDHGKIVAQSTEAGFKLLVIQTASLLLVKVPVMKAIKKIFKTIQCIEIV